MNTFPPLRPDDPRRKTLRKLMREVEEEDRQGAYTPKVRHAIDAFRAYPPYVMLLASDLLDLHERFAAIHHEDPRRFLLDPAVVARELKRDLKALATPVGSLNFCTNAPDRWILVLIDRWNQTRTSARNLLDNLDDEFTSKPSIVALNELIQVFEA